MNESMKHEKFIKIPTSSKEIKTAMVQMYVGMLCREQNSEIPVSHHVFFNGDF